jgi:hypothetical protein
MGTRRKPLIRQELGSDVEVVLSHEESSLTPGRVDGCRSKLLSACAVASQGRSP